MGDLESRGNSCRKRNRCGFIAIGLLLSFGAIPGAEPIKADEMPQEGATATPRNPVLSPTASRSSRIDPPVRRTQAGPGQVRRPSIQALPLPYLPASVPRAKHTLGRRTIDQSASRPLRYADQQSRPRHTRAGYCDDTIPRVRGSGSPLSHNAEPHALVRFAADHSDSTQSVRRRLEHITPGATTSLDSFTFTFPCGSRSSSGTRRRTATTWPRRPMINNTGPWFRPSFWPWCRLIASLRPPLTGASGSEWPASLPTSTTGS